MPASTLYCACAPFEAARQIALPHPAPADHPARRLHGHSFTAQVRAALGPAWAKWPGGEVSQLSTCLQACTAELDYRHLNELLELPTDENIARWLRERLQAQVPGLTQVSIQSTADQGVDLDAHGHAHIWRRYRFEAAHKLPNVPFGHKCGRLHGHGFEVIVHANQGAGAQAQGLDHARLDALWAPFQLLLHHKYLNAIEGLDNPTSEVIAGWLWQRLKAVLPELSWVTVYETGSCGANFNGHDYRIWKEMTLDSALFLRHAPEDNPLSHIHGHTYTMRLHLSAPLDQVMGWTVDFGDVKERFNPIFKALDHHPLHELPGLDDCDAASLAHWVLAQGQRTLAQLDRVDMHETRGCGAIALMGHEGPALPV